jgi:hypothetical protein
VLKSLASGSLRNMAPCRSLHSMQTDRLKELACNIFLLRFFGFCLFLFCYLSFLLFLGRVNVDRIKVMMSGKA